MSSHHIVRDAQEPALIIANGEACAAELLGQLLEWSPTVVVLDGAAERAASLGIKIDVLLGDFDRLDNLEEIRQAQYPVEIVCLPDQESTDLEKGIEFLIERGYPAANIVWATGKRADHTLNNLMSLVKYQGRINLVMWDDYSKIFPVNGHFEKWYTQGSVISLLPVGTAAGVVTEGLKYNLSDEDLESGGRSGSSNEAIRDGIVKISLRAGNLLLMECHD